MKRLAVVTLCNNYSRTRKWFPTCVETWPDLMPGAPKFFVSDGSLGSADLKSAASLCDATTNECQIDQDEVGQELRRYPCTALMREKCVFFKRIFDFKLLFREFDYVLNVDTDIAVTAPVSLPSALPDFAFCVDDIPGYSAKPSAVFQEPLVTGLNAGFLLFRTEVIDFDFVEYVARRYLLEASIPWWAEQTCWALIAGRCNDVRVFSPDDVAIVSGLRKRTVSQIRKCKTSYFRGSKGITDLAEIEAIVGDAPVIHFAGPGKPWIEPVISGKKRSAAQRKASMAKPLAFRPVPHFPVLERFSLYLRLASQRVRKRAA